MLAISTTQWSCRTSSAGGYTLRDCDETMSIDPDDMPVGNGNHLVNSDAALWKTIGTAIKTSFHLVSRRWLMRLVAMAVKARKCSGLRS
ncbi:hypothetical protein [Streptomyces sp. NPDC002685]|uniref:hypothetical protein n=1 Tax=Streptomyces sp. NPDC002685 TaxID=3154540 RepID=UPI003330C61B